jgi:hypothetical protein
LPGLKVPVRCLHVLLRSTFHRDETHRRSARGLAEIACIARIVLYWL